MSAEIRSFRKRPERLYRGDLPVFRQLLLPLVGDPCLPKRIADAASGLLAHLDRETVPFSQKEFVMLFPSQQRAVARMLRKSSRPAVANELWAVCFENMTREGEVAFDRAFFAQELGVGPRVVSQLMLELVKFECLLRQGTPRRYRYFVNPNIGTRGGLSKALDDAQAAAPVLPLVGLGDRPTERRSRARLVVAELV